MQKGIPLDSDSFNNRVQDILYHDKSKYDEKSAILVSDYIGISKILWNHIENEDKNVAEQLKKEIDKIVRIQYGNDLQINESEILMERLLSFQLIR